MTSPERGLALQHTLYESRNATRRYLHRSRRAWVSAALHGLQVPLGLEVGIGSGMQLCELAEHAERLIAMDTQHLFLRRAWSAIPDERVLFVQGDLQRVPLADQCCDLIVCSEVIEHLEPGTPVIATLARLLTPGGRLVLTTPQPCSPIELLARVAFLPGIRQILGLIYREPLEPLGHGNLYAASRLRREFAAAGLRVQRSELLGLYLPVIAEFGGDTGQRVLAWLEARLRCSPLRWMLWTQCYVLERPSGASGADADSSR